MATVNQLVRKGRKTKNFKSNVPALESSPQKRGVCTRVYTTTPKKAEFGTYGKVARVQVDQRLMRLRVISAVKVITLQEHSVIFNREAGGSRICPAYVITRFAARSIVRLYPIVVNGRSKYGTKRPKN